MSPSGGIDPSAAERARLLRELRTLIGRHARPDKTTSIDGVLLSAEDRAGGPSPERTGTMMALIVRGTKRIALGDRIYDYRSGQYLVASIDLPVTGHYLEADVAQPALGFGLTLHPASIASLLLEAKADETRPARSRPSAAPSAFGVADASNDLLDVVLRMVRLLDQHSDRSILAPLIKKEILWRLLNGPMGQGMRQIALTDSSLTQISHAVRWISQHHPEPFRVEELARSCGMSASAFHRAFHTVTGLSPIQFRKQIRLHESRLLLMSGVDDIATIASRVGYDSVSQFSREYRGHFGLPPGRDAARLRANAQVPA
jgi:AraC-like DNA-binding protein